MDVNMKHSIHNKFNNCRSIDHVNRLLLLLLLLLFFIEKKVNKLEFQYLSY